MLDPSHRPGYNEIAAVCSLSRNDPAWLSLMGKTLNLPAWMLPAVVRAVNQGAWRLANDPITSVRQHAIRVARRTGLRDQEPAVPTSE